MINSLEMTTLKELAASHPVVQEGLLQGEKLETPNISLPSSADVGSNGKTNSIA